MVGLVKDAKLDYFEARSVVQWSFRQRENGPGLTYMGSNEVRDIGIFGSIVLLQWGVDRTVKSSFPDPCYVDWVDILSSLRNGLAGLSLTVRS